jgi:hypothetical protein
MHNWIVLIILFTLIAEAPAQSTSDVHTRIVEYTLSKEGKRIKRGECWDLVAEALDYAGANWQRPRGFGEKVDYEQEPILPGDIIEFRKARFERPDGRSGYEMPEHFAVIVEVPGPGRYLIGHQNYNGRKRVGFAEVDMAHKKRGRVTIYRPQ